VDWSGEFPVFEGGLAPLNIKQKMPKGVKNQTGKNDFLPNGNFTFTDNFSSEIPDYRWIGVRGPRENFISGVEQGLQINFPHQYKSASADIHFILSPTTQFVFRDNDPVLHSKIRKRFGGRRLLPKRDL
jgi:hypothetical protein